MALERVLDAAVTAGAVRRAAAAAATEVRSASGAAKAADAVPVDAFVKGLLRASGETAPSRALLEEHLRAAAAFGGDSSELTLDQARIGVATYLEQMGKTVEAADVRALASNPTSAFARDLGFSTTELSVLSDLPPAAQALLEGSRQADAEVRALAERVAQGLTDVRPMGADGYSTQLFSAQAGDQRVVLRGLASRNDVTQFEAERSNNLVNKLAHQIQAPDFTLASVEIPTPAPMRAGGVTSDTVMVLPYAGDGFANAGTRSGQLTNPNAARIPEERRIDGAYLSYGIRHEDARPNNTMVDADGNALFMDHDAVLARPAWHVQQYGPVFDDYFKGRALGYSSDLSTFDQFPERHQVAVEGIASMNVEQLSAMYELPEVEARVLLDQHRYMREGGLEGAIAAHPFGRNG